MLKTVKIDMEEYKAIKEYARKQGRFLQHILADAIRTYLAVQSSKEKA